MPPPALVGRGKCAIETTLSGLIPFSQLFATLTEQGVQRRVVLGNLADFAKEVAPAWLDIFTGGVAGAVIKTVEQSGKLLSNQPSFTQQNVYVQFTNALGRLAEKQPVVAFIDDLHWADSSSLGLLFHLACYLQDRAVLFLCTYRPGGGDGDGHARQPLSRYPRQPDPLWRARCRNQGRHRGRCLCRAALPLPFVPG